MYLNISESSTCFSPPLCPLKIGKHAVPLATRHLFHMPETSGEIQSVEEHEEKSWAKVKMIGVVIGHDDCDS